MFSSYSFKKYADSLAAAVAGFIIIFCFTRHGGIGVCPDGVVYLTTAENVHSNGNLTDFTHNAVVNFPAFYPLFLTALMMLIGFEPLQFTPLLNALLFAVIIFLSGQMTAHFLNPSKWYKRAVLGCIVISPCLLEVYSMVWSETIFIVWWLLFMMAMHQYCISHSRKALIAAAIIASLAAVTRYAGVSIIATGALLLLLDTKLPRLRKLQDILIFSVISPLLLIINFTRNYIVSGTITGGRERAISTLNENINDAGSVLYDWVFFFNRQSSGAGWVVVLLIAGFSFTCIKQFLKYRRFTTYENMAAVFALLFLLFMVLTASISRFETLNSRLLSPLFIPLIWCSSNWILSLSQTINHSKKKWLTAFGIFIFLSFQYNQLSKDYETWDGVKDAGIPGYTEDQWKYSATVQFIQKDSLSFTKGHTIYSNAYDAVYFFTKREGKYLPHKEFKSEVQEFLNNRHCYVVWFTDGEDADLVELDFIINIKKMKLIRQFNDGAVYEYDE